MSEAHRARSFRDSLKNTSIVGLSQVLVMALGIVRSKITAISMGPAGIGTLSALTSTTSLAQSLAGLGLARSSVRPIAETDSEDVQREWASLSALLGLAFGSVGALALVGLRGWLSNLTFANDSHADAFVALSLTVPLAIFTSIASAALQGARKHALYALLQISGAVLSTAVGGGLALWLGDDAVVPYILALSAGSALSALFVIGVRAKLLRWPQKLGWLNVKELVRLGLSFALLDVFNAVVNYTRNTALFRLRGAEETGLYQAASSLSTILVGLILAAIGTDLLPRLAAIKEPHKRHEVVNEQVEIALLLVAPCVAWSALLAPTVLSGLFAKAFAQGATVFRWLLVASAIRVLNWPVGYLLLAGRNDRIYVVSDVALGTLEWGLSLGAVWLWGIEGLGASIACSYALAVLIMRQIAFKTSGFTWAAELYRLMAAVTVCLAVSFYGGTASEVWSLRFALGAIAASGLSVGCAWWLLHRAGTIGEQSRLGRLLQRFRR